MGIFDFLRSGPKNTANVAKDRLRFIVMQERNARGGPAYPPLLRRELLDVIKKYVNVDLDAVKVDLVKEGDHDVLDISVSLPDKDEPRTAVAGA